MTISAIKVDEFGGFVVSFNQDVADLKAGDDIYLQLPEDVNCEHDPDYNEETHDEVIALIKEEYTNEQLSIMALLGTSDIEDVVIKSGEVTGTDGEKEYTLNVSVLKVGDDELLVQEVQRTGVWGNSFYAWVEYEHDLVLLDVDFDKFETLEYSKDYA